MSTKENPEKLEGFAEITCRRNDMFWKFSQYRTTADGQSEWFKATWTGYNDANWWNNVAPNARQVKCTGDKGTTVVLEIDFRTNHVAEVKEVTNEF